MIFAGVGDVHGHMHRMVGLLSQWEQANGAAFDFVLQVGDFEPHRNELDVATMAAPGRYRKLGDFPDFAEGRAAFPWPVYFIGGNHEPYGMLDQRPDGYSLVTNCHYLGRAGHVDLDGLRIAGLSGIYREDAYRRPRPSVADISHRSNKDYIHFVEADVERVFDVGRVDVLILHEWPDGIIGPGDEREFEQQRQSLRYDTVGNPAARMLVDLMQPKLVLCGHMHRAYRARIERTQVACFAHIPSGEGAFGVFTLDEQGGIEELTQ